MDRIKQREKDGITWYDNEDIVDKIHELVEGYNDLNNRLDKHIKYHNKMDKQDNKDYGVIKKYRTKNDYDV